MYGCPHFLLLGIPDKFPFPSKKGEIWIKQNEGFLLVPYQVEIPLHSATETDFDQFLIKMLKSEKFIEEKENDDESDRVLKEKFRQQQAMKKEKERVSEVVNEKQLVKLEKEKEVTKEILGSKVENDQPKDLLKEKPKDVQTFIFGTSPIDILNEKPKETEPSKLETFKFGTSETLKETSNDKKTFKMEPFKFDVVPKKTINDTSKHESKGNKMIKVEKTKEEPKEIPKEFFTTSAFPLKLEKPLQIPKEIFSQLPKVEPSKKVLTTSPVSFSNSEKQKPEKYIIQLRNCEQMNHSKMNALLKPLVKDLPQLFFYKVIYYDDLKGQDLVEKKWFYCCRLEFINLSDAEVVYDAFNHTYHNNCCWEMKKTYLSTIKDEQKENVTFNQITESFAQLKLPKPKNLLLVLPWLVGDLLGEVCKEIIYQIAHDALREVNTKQYTEVTKFIQEKRVDDGVIETSQSFSFSSSFVRKQPLHDDLPTFHFIGQ